MHCLYLKIFNFQYIKRYGLTDSGLEVYLFNNDWSGTDNWQFSTGQTYLDKSDLNWMNTASSG